MTDTDYRFKFPLTGLSLALEALAALRAANIITSGKLPDNMLGTPRDAAGVAIVDGSDPAFRGGPGRAAISYTDPDTQQVIDVPAAGDPGYWYVAIRSTTPPSDVPFDPTTYGLIPCDADESAAVLGVWASTDAE
jgi:hypothetical protein